MSSSSTLHLLDTSALRDVIRARLQGTGPSQQGEPWVAGLPPELTATYRHLFPPVQRTAAVLVPIVDHGSELSVLLTQRAQDLQHHPGQISFPGGRIERDESALAAALREAQEEIGLEARYVEVVGYLPDHLVVSGYRVTPVVAMVEPGFELRLYATEVTAAFEVPLRFLLDPANHQVRLRKLGDREIEVYDIVFENRNIWGATAGMLLTLQHVLGT